jgi:hypothetical protein
MELAQMFEGAVEVVENLRSELDTSHP